MDGNQWLLCIGFAIALTLVYKVIKFFLRRARGEAEPVPVAATSVNA